MHSASNVFKAIFTTRDWEAKHLVPCAERTFGFHQMDFSVFHITLSCKSWSMRGICDQILATSTEISRCTYIVMTAMRTSV